MPERPRAGRTVMAADRLAIAYDVRGNGRTALVFVHGWAGDRRLWYRQLWSLARDFRVVALDLGGHGASGRNRRSWTLASLAGDVAALVEGLGLERVVLVGHAMGGPVSLDAARRLRGRVRAVVCVDTLHNVEAQPLVELQEKTARQLEADFPAAMSRLAAGFFPAARGSAAHRLVERQALAADPRVAVALLREFGRQDLKAALAAVRVPVICLNAAPRGDAGTATAVDVNRRYADFEAVLLEGVGHFPMLERPDEFDAHLRKLIARLAGQASS